MTHGLVIVGLKMIIRWRLVPFEAGQYQHLLQVGSWFEAEESHLLEKFSLTLGTSLKQGSQTM